MYDRALVVFFKTPVLGRVKTRLASKIGEDRALVVYKRMLKQVISIAKNWSFQTPNSCVLFFGSGEPRSWNEFGVDHGIQQVGADLGMRMQRAMQFAFQKAREVAIIGTDTPHLSTSDIDRAFEQLKQVDVSFGPCPDGGYYLMACRKLPPTLLWDLPWSSDKTLERLRYRCEGHHLSMNQIDIKRDIDTLEDMKSLNFAKDIWGSDI